MASAVLGKNGGAWTTERKTERAGGGGGGGRRDDISNDIQATLFEF